MPRVLFKRDEILRHRFQRSDHGRSTPARQPAGNRKRMNPRPPLEWIGGLLRAGGDVVMEGHVPALARVLLVRDRLLGPSEGTSSRKRNAPRVVIICRRRAQAVSWGDFLRQILPEERGKLVRVCIGGTPVQEDRKRMAPGVDLLVLTQGRAVELVDARVLLPESVELLVLEGLAGPRTPHVALDQVSRILETCLTRGSRLAFARPWDTEDIALSAAEMEALCGSRARHRWHDSPVVPHPPWLRRMDLDKDKGEGSMAPEGSAASDRNTTLVRSRLREWLQFPVLVEWDALVDACREDS